MKRGVSGGGEVAPHAVDGMLFESVRLPFFFLYSFALAKCLCRPAGSAEKAKPSICQHRQEGGCPRSHHMRMQRAVGEGEGQKKEGTGFKDEGEKERRRKRTIISFN